MHNRTSGASWRLAVISLIVVLGIGAAGGAGGPGGPGGFGLIARARAATVQALDLVALVARAQLIVVGQARERQSRWTADGKLMMTDVSIRVEESLKGSAEPGQDIVVTRMGGQLDGLGLKVPGSATFELGAVAVVFLRRHPVTQELRAVGMSQGVLPVEVRDGYRTVRPGGAGAAMMAADEGGTLRAAPGALIGALRLSDLSATIRQLVLSQGTL